MFARHRNARRMDDVSLNIVHPQPAGEPEAVPSGFIGDNHALDRMPGQLSFLAPTMQELQQRLLIRVELFERLALDARNNRGYQPFRLTHFHYGDDRIMLLQGGEGPASVKSLRHGALHWCRSTAPRVPQALTARPISSAQLLTHATQHTPLRVSLDDLIMRPFHRVLGRHALDRL